MAMLVPVFLFSMMLVIPVGIIVHRASSANGERLAGRSPAVAVPVAFSAVQYALAYAVVYFLQELFLWWPKAVLGLDAVLYHNNHTWAVAHPLDSLLQGTGALAIFVFGAAIAFAYRMRKPRAAAWRLLMLWTIYHALTQSVFQLGDPALNPDGDVGDALAYLGFPVSLRLPVFLAAMAAIAALGTVLSRELATALPSLADAGSLGRQMRFAALWIIGGGILGAVLLIPFKVPPLPQIIGPFLLAVFPSLWVVASWSRPIANAAAPDGFRNRELLTAAVLLTAMLAFYQLVLAPGIRL